MFKGMGAALVVVLLLGASGCFAHTHKVDRNTGVPVMLSDAGGATGRHFEASAKELYLLWGLVPLTGDKTSTLLQNQSYGSSGLKNVEIESEMSFVDGLVTVLTYQLFGMRTVTVKGDTIAGEGSQAPQAPPTQPASRSPYSR